MLFIYIDTLSGSISGDATPPLAKRLMSATKDTVVEEASQSSSGQGLQGAPLNPSEYIYLIWHYTELIKLCYTTCSDIMLHTYAQYFHFQFVVYLHTLSRWSIATANINTQG